MSDLPPDPLQRIESSIRSLEEKKAQLRMELARAEKELQELERAMTPLSENSP